MCIESHESRLSQLRSSRLGCLLKRAVNLRLSQSPSLGHTTERPPNITNRVNPALHLGRGHITE